MTWRGAQGGYDVYADTVGTMQYASAATNADGTSAASGSGSASLSAYDGTETILVNDTQNGSTYNVTFLSAHFIGEGTTVMNGVSTYKDSVNGIATADFTDQNGVAWHASGVADADGVSTDVTLSTSTGFSSVSKYTNSLWAPSFIGLQSAARATQGSRHTLGNNAKVAIAAGVVSGVMYAVAGVTASMGLLPAAGVALVLGTAAAVVAGQAAAADSDEANKPGKKC